MSVRVARSSYFQTPLNRTAKWATPSTNQNSRRVAQIEAANQGTTKALQRPCSDGPPLSLASFAGSLELDSIAVLDEHTAETAYVPVDEHMFGGHFVVCTIRKDDAVSNAHRMG